MRVCWVCAGSARVNVAEKNFSEFIFLNQRPAPFFSYTHTLSLSLSLSFSLLFPLSLSRSHSISLLLLPLSFSTQRLYAKNLLNV